MNAKDKLGHNALFCAVKSDNIETVQALLLKGADVDAKNNNGGTALKLAEATGRTEIIRLLKDAGAEE